MTTAEIPNHGEPEQRVELNQEENRCLTYLKKYYILFKEKTEEEALKEAWKDLQKEHESLQQYTWFK